MFKNWGGYGEGKGRRGTEKLAFSDIIFEQHLKKFGVGAFALAAERRYAFPLSRKKGGPRRPLPKKPTDDITGHLEFCPPIFDISAAVAAASSSRHSGTKRDDLGS